MRAAIDKFKDYADTGRIAATELQFGSENYPASLEQLVDGVPLANDASGRKMKFLRRIPIDPLTNSTDWGLRAYQDMAERRRPGAGRTSTTSTRRRTAKDSTARSTGTGETMNINHSHAAGGAAAGR